MTIPVTIPVTLVSRADDGGRLDDLHQRIAGREVGDNDGRARSC
jgi:hypothetical protein